MAQSGVGRPSGKTSVRWTKSMTAAFLDHLAVTCNVLASAEAIGVCHTRVYYKRRGDAAFRAQWEEALACGYQLVETRLVGHALAGGDSHGVLPGSPDEPPICADYAMRLLAMRQSSLAGRRAAGGPPRATATKEETVKAILKKLTALEKAGL